MNKTIPLVLILPLLVPMALAAVGIRFGGGPTMEQVIARFESPEEDVRVDALRWMRPLRRAILWESVTPMLEDPNPRVRDRAIEVLEKMKNPQALPALDAAFDRRVDDLESITGAMRNAGYPQVFPYLEKRLNDPDEAIRLLAGEEIHSLRGALNQEVCFYSLGDPIYNGLGDMIAAQAALFPAGRERIAAGPNKMGRDRSKDEHQP